ncbi:putative L-cysteine desulfurase [Intestinibaculum porci]|uniref:cysteine desulfurase n=1 Tax=Intestinibaculum porci TaxID=2487118 RepID=A0A3G9J6D0_9FIRM|nr:aminotransferase class V-fold PLP-dependent enzyme [Intestinibaculum porci]BBH26286.1 putative L-cysteine desulfurase [Intestinibaculum porci]
MAIYLDYNASAPIHPDVLKIMIDVYTNHYGNANSRTHDFGSEANKIVTYAREQLASMLGVKKDEIFFTSGSTESDNIAIQGLKEYGVTHNKKHIITSSIEHHAVLNTCKHLEKEGFKVDYVEPDENGRIDAQNVLDLVDEQTLLVSIMHVNNETGIIQPVKEIGDVLYDQDVFFHVDATQSAGKLIDEIKNLKYDMLSLSAHKFAGPQGVGALVLRKKRYKLPPVKPVMFGGGQEHGIRPGTIPVALVAGLGKAAEIAEREHSESLKKAKENKKIILQLLENSGLDYKINGDPQYCVPSTLNVSLEGISSEALMLATKNYCGISNGSACTSNSYDPSYVLSAMRLSQERINSAIRLSWGYNTNSDDLKYDFSHLLDVAKGLR